VWNELPDCVVKASTCSIFRRLVDGLDLQKYRLVCDWCTQCLFMFIHVLVCFALFVFVGCLLVAFHLALYILCNVFFSLNKSVQFSSVQTETLTSRDRDETETLALPAETRPRRDVKISRRDRDETFTALETLKYTFLPRCMECRRGLAMRKLSLCPSVRPSNA